MPHKVCSFFSVVAKLALMNRAQNIQPSKSIPLINDALNTNFCYLINIILDVNNWISKIRSYR
jgi:hypothetical protein